jgi:predicted nucleotidyltransferase
MTINSNVCENRLSHEIGSFFDGSRKSCSKVRELTNNLLENKYHNVFVFGGMIRDIGLCSAENFNSDIDLVFSGNQKELTSIVSMLDTDEIYENKFGGLRLNLGAWDVDIWCVENTWAFENKHVEFNSINDILKTTLMSWDSALFNVRTQELLVGNSYFDNLNNRHLDLVLGDTPNEIGAYVRLARTILSKDVKTVSKRMVNSIELLSSKFTCTEVVEYESESFINHTLSKDKVRKLIDSIVIF